MVTSYLCQLPKYLRFKIFSELTSPDLSSLSQTNKSYHQICVCDDFWSFKVRFDFPEFSQLKHPALTFKQWYWKLKNSGNLYTTCDVCSNFGGIDLKTPKFVATNVIKSYPVLNDGLFYITIFDELYFTGMSSRLSMDWMFCDKMTDHSTYLQPTKIMDNIVDIHFFGDGILCLRPNGMLIMCSNGNYLKFDGNFKTISGGTKFECLCITNDDELYHLAIVHRKPVLSKVSKSISFASHGIFDRSRLIAYYVTKTGELRTYYPSNEYKMHSIPKLGMDRDYSRPTIVHKNLSLVQSDIKSAHMLYNYLLIVDRHDELWIYRKYNFTADPIFELTFYFDESVVYNKIDDDESGEYDNLVGWNQDRYHDLKIKMVKSNYSFTNVCILDTEGNLYYIVAYQLHDIKLEPVLCHVISCFNDCYVTVITRRGFNPVISKSAESVDSELTEDSFE